MGPLRRSSRSDLTSSSSSRLRVLFVGHRFPPDGAGGYELHCASLRRHLVSRGHTVQVLVGTRGLNIDARDPAVRRSLRWKAQDVELDHESAWAFERHNRAELEATLDSFAPDVVVWWRLAESSMSLVELVRERAIPALGIVGDGWLHEGRGRDPWDRYRVEPLDYSDAGPWVFNSHRLRRSTARMGIPLARTAVLSPGVDLTLFRPGPRRPWSGRLLYAGRVSPAKGVDVAVDALAELPGAQLTIVGDGDPAYVAGLERRAASLGLATRVRVRPAVGRSELAEHYRAADAVLFPVRREEPLGLVPLEAMGVRHPGRRHRDGRLGRVPGARGERAVGRFRRPT